MVREKLQDDEQLGRTVGSRIKLTKPWDRHSREEKILKCDEAGIPRKMTCRVYHVSPNTISNLKKGKEGSSEENNTSDELAALLFSDFDRNVEPEKVVVTRKVSPHIVMEQYQLWLELKNIDILPLKARIDSLEQSNASLRQIIVDLEEQKENLRTQIRAAYQEGYHKGVKEGNSSGMKFGWDLAKYILKRVMPSASNHKIENLLRSGLDAYETELVSKELKQLRSGI